MRGRWAVHLGVLLGLASCVRPYWERRNGASLRDVDAGAAVLKLHLASGEVYVLSPWRFSPQAEAVVGEGELRPPDRSAARRGTFTVPVKSVVIFETNTQKEQTSVGVVATVTLVALIDVLALAFVIAFVSTGSDR